jgi:hypothetical protein
MLWVAWWAKMGGAAMNPNKALWEKGDFTRIAESMRASGVATSIPATFFARYRRPQLIVER